MNLGGYFASLTLTTDKASFDKGVQSLASVEKGAHRGSSAFKGFSGAIVKTTATLFASVVAMNLLEDKSLLQAKLANESASAYVKWGLAVRNAGIDAKGFASGVTALDEKFTRLRIGELDINMAKSVGMLGLNLGAMRSQNSDQRTNSIYGAALGMKDERKAAELVGNLLGEAGRQYFYYMKVSGISLNDQLAKAKALAFTDESSKKKAMTFSYEFRSLMGGFKEMGLYVSSEIGAFITPAIKVLEAALINAKPRIKSALNGITSLFTGIGDKFMSNFMGEKFKHNKAAILFDDIFQYLIGSAKKTWIGSIIDRVKAAITKIRTEINSVITPIDLKNIIPQAFIATLGILAGLLESMANSLQLIHGFRDVIWGLVTNNKGLTTQGNNKVTAAEQAQDTVSKRVFDGIFGYGAYDKVQDFFDVDKRLGIDKRLDSNLGGSVYSSAAYRPDVMARKEAWMVSQNIYFNGPTDQAAATAGVNKANQTMLDKQKQRSGTNVEKTNASTRSK